MAVKQISSHAELKLDLVGFVDMWVQFYNIPVKCVTEEGIQILARALWEHRSLHQSKGLSTVDGLLKLKL